MSMFWDVLPLERRFENTGSASTYFGIAAPSRAACGVSTDADWRNSTSSGWLLAVLSQPAAVSAASIPLTANPRCNDLRVDTDRDIAILLNEPTKSVRA